MAKEPIDISTAPLAQSMAAKAQAQIDEARDWRLRIDEQLDALWDMVPTALSDKKRIEYEDYVRRLVLTWLRLTPAAILASERGEPSPADLKEFLFPESSLPKGE